MELIDLEQRVPSPEEQQKILTELYRLIIDRCDHEAASFYARDEIPDSAFRKVDDAPVAPPSGAASDDYEVYEDLAPEDFNEVPDEGEKPGAPSSRIVAVTEPERLTPLTPEEEQAARELDEWMMFGNPDQAANYFATNLDENRLRPVLDLLAPILRRHRIDDSNDAVAFRRFLREANIFAREAFDDARRRAAGGDTSGERKQLLDAARSGTRFIVPAAARSQSPSPTVAVDSGTDDPDCLIHAPLSECVEQYVRSKAGKKWDEKQARDSKPIFKLMIDFFGDVSPATIRRTDAVRYRDTLARMPTQTRSVPFHGLSMQEMIALADKIEADFEDGGASAKLYAGRRWIVDGHVDRFSLKNQDKYINYVHGLFEYILDTLPLDARAFRANPFKKLLHGHATIRKRRGEVRVQWTLDEIEKLLTSPIWSGCRSEWYCSEPGGHVIKNDRYWLPIICLFGGMRLAEACQLKARDIEAVEGRPFYFIRRGKGQKVKNEGSLRAVPIHQRLLDAGFLDYVASRRADGEGWLFPARSKTKRVRKDSPHLTTDEFSKWWLRYRTAIGIGGDDHDFHSLRHTFTTYAKNQGVKREIVQALIGHASGKETIDDYFHGYEPIVLYESVKKLDYGVSVENR
jgi:integrase